jgi:hypothetical protein
MVKHTGEYNYAQHAEQVVRYEQMRHPGIFRAKSYQDLTPSPTFHCDSDKAGESA